MAEKFSDRLIPWLPYTLAVQVLFFLVVSVLYFSRPRGTQHSDSREASPKTAGEAWDNKPSSTHKAILSPTIAGEAWDNKPSSIPAPRPEHQRIKELIPQPRPVVEVHKVGPLPEGLELEVGPNAVLAKDGQGNTEFLLHTPVMEADNATWVVFRHEGVEVYRTVISPHNPNPVSKPATFEWAAYEIESNVPGISLTYQGEGHLVTLRNGKSWLLIPRPNGEDWVKALANLPGHKQSAALIYPKPGERSTLRFEMQKDAPPFEHSLPDDVAIFVNVSRYGEFKERLNELRGVKLCQDPVMEPFVSRFLDSGQKSRSELRKQTGVDLVNLCAAHTGQISLAFRLPGAADLPPFIPGTPHNQKELISKRERFKQLWRMKPLWSFLSDIPGSRDSIQNMLEQMDQTEIADEIYLEITDNHVLYGAERAEEATHLRGWLKDPPKDPFALNPRFQEFRNRTGGTGDFEVYVDLPRFRDVLRNGAEFQELREDLAWVTYYGGDRFESVGLSFSIAKEPFDSIGHLVINTKNRPLLFSILELPPRSLEPEPWVPADITSYYSFTWNRALGRDVIENIYPFTRILGERLTVVTDLTESRGFLVPRVLLAWERNRSVGDNFLEDFQNFLLELKAQDQPKTEKRTTPKGVTIYSRDYSQKLESEIAPDKPVPVGKVAMTATKTHILLATHVELLEKVLNHQGPGLSESADYRRVAQHFPDACSLIVYRAPEQNRLVFQALKTGQLPSWLKGDGPLAELFAGLIDALDGRKLPEYDSIKHFFTPAGGYAIMDDSGFRYTHFSLQGE